MSHQKVKGTNKERKLRELLYNKGIISLRVAGSGSTRKVPSIDLIIIYRGRALGVEVKSVNKLRNIHINTKQLDKLSKISEHIEVWFAVHVRRVGWKFVKYDKYKTINKEEIKKGLDLIQFVEYIKSNYLGKYT